VYVSVFGKQWNDILGESLFLFYNFSSIIVTRRPQNSNGTLQRSV